MNNIKKKISQSIVDPTAKSRSVSTLEGKVIKSNENSNTCKVEYNDFNGRKETRDSVPVLVYNKSIIDWFPKINEKVLLQEKDEVIYIIGPAMTSYLNIRSSIKLENDIYSDTFISGIGGYLF